MKIQKTIKRHTTVLVLCMMEFSVLGQRTVMGDLININKFFAGSDFFYINLRYSYYNQGNKQPAERKDAFVAIHNNEAYNNVANLEMVRTAVVNVSVNHQSKTVTILPPTNKATVNQSFENMISGIDTLVKTCKVREVMLINPKQAEIVLKNCSSPTYSEVDLEYFVDTFKPTKITLHQNDENQVETGKLEVEYLSIEKLKKDKNNYLNTSKFITKNTQGFVLNQNLSGYKVDDYTR